MLEAGKQFSVYTIKEVLSETATHTCCLTKDPFFSRTLLIKLYPLDFYQDKQQCEEFEAGLEQLILLEHPSIAPIFDSGFVENYFYYTTSYQYQLPLYDQTIENPSDNQIMQWVEDIAGACEYALATGLVHGRLGVDDLFISEGGKAIIADFGVEHYLECFLQNVSADLSEVRILKDLGIIQRQLLQPLSKDIDGLEEEVLAGIASAQLQDITARLLPEHERRYRSIAELLADIEVLLSAEPTETRPVVQQKKLQALDDTEIYLHERELVLPQLRDLISEKNRYKALLDEALIDHNKLESCLRKTQLELEHVNTLQLEAPKQNGKQNRKQLVGMVLAGVAFGAILSAGYGYTLLQKNQSPPAPLTELANIATGEASTNTKVETETIPVEAVDVTSTIVKEEKIDKVVPQAQIVTEYKPRVIPIMAENNSTWVAAGSEFNDSPRVAKVVKSRNIIPSVADLSVYDRNVILNSIATWASAWSQQDIPAYLSHYSHSYIPEGDTSYEEWLQMRKSRLQRYGGINVGVSNAKIRRVEKNRVQVKFQQNYKSQNYSDKIIKSINLVNETGGWKILTERSLGKVTAVD